VILLDDTLSIDMIEINYC